MDGHDLWILAGLGSEWKLSTEDPAEFPPVPAFDAADYFTLAATDLARAIERTIFATDQGSTRYALGGVSVELGNSKDDGKAMNAWEIAGLKSAVFVDGTVNDPRDTDRGWSVELAFPWRVLAEQARRPTPPREGDQWRVNFSRVQWPIETSTGKYVKPKGAREDNWVWSPQHVVDMHRPETWGYVQFTSRAAGDVEPSRAPAP